MAVKKLKPIEERDPYAALVLDTFDRMAAADPNPRKGMTVVLEDGGQDFLEFDIKDGCIVETRPFQGDVWNGMPVLNEVIQPGDYIAVRTLRRGVRTFRYQVIAVRQMEG